MADSKRYNGSTWEHSLRKLTTATDMFTTLPVDVYADGNSATVGLKGNTVQNGTPSPDNPIMPQGTGERTGNLFDYSAVTTGYRIIWTTGELYADSTGIMSDFIEVSEDKTYKISDTVIEAFTAYIIGYNSNKEYLGAYHPTDGFRKAASSRYSSINVPTGYDCKYIKLMTYTSNDLGNTSMFTEGSSLPSTFIPYGYKIPISSASVTTNVYLGEVETTRNIKKLVLDGSENWRSSSGIMYLDTLSDDYMRASGVITCICTHYPSQEQVNSVSRVNEGCIALGSTVNQRLYVYDTNISLAADYKTYLQQQYAAGTPVVVYYVLAEPETGIVNEPLMRIGDYADTVSGITVPTITDKDTFDVDTILKPSEVSLSYTGWHNATVKEWDGSQWNE